MSIKVFRRKSYAGSAVAFVDFTFFLLFLQIIELQIVELKIQKVINNCP